MVYERRVKKGNSTYVYKVKSYRDKETGKVKNDYEYMGKEVEKKGKREIIPPKHKNTNVRKALTYGTVIALYNIAKEFGFPKIIDKIFEDKTLVENVGEKITILAINKILSADGINAFGSWFSNTSFATNSSLKYTDFSPKKVRKLNELLTKTNPDCLGLIEQNIAKKINSKYKEDTKTIVYDLTSIPFQGCKNELAEFGSSYKKNGNNRQINLALAITKELKLPLHHRLLPGSIPSVLTIKNFTKELKDYNVKNILLIIDRGFNSERNIKEIISEKHQIIGCVSAQLKLYKQTISQCSEIENPKNYFKQGEEILFFKEIEINDIRYIAYHSPKKVGIDKETFFNKLHEIETTLKSLSKIKFELKNELIEEMKNLCKEYYDLFIFEYQKSKQFTYSLNEQEIKNKMQRFGKTVLFTTTNLDAKAVITQYREKDVVEKTFHIMKQNNLGPTNTTTEKSTKSHCALVVFGYLFLALLRNRLSDLDLPLNEIMSQLEKIKEVTFSNGTTSLTEFTKNQRLVMEKLNL